MGAEVLDWHAQLEVGIGFMDEDHRHAVELINALATGQDAVAALRAYLGHCEEHFAREEELMRRTGFFAIGPHSDEHARVLNDLRAVLAQAEAGQELDHGALARELADWLLGHRNSMDLVTAQFARAHGRS